MDDLIERQALIDAHYEYCNKHPEAEFHVWSLELMQNAPSVQPETHGKRTETHGVCLDAISRQAAIDAICKTGCDSTYCGVSCPDVMAIENLPSAQPEPQWIPCSERMPEDLEEVNVTWVNHDPEPYYDFTKDKPATASAVYYKGKWYWYSSVCTDLLAEYGENEVDKMDDAIEVLAWMPLPEPWKGEEHD